MIMHAALNPSKHHVEIMVIEIEPKDIKSIWNVIESPCRHHVFMMDNAALNPSCYITRYILDLLFLYIFLKH